MAWARKLPSGRWQAQWRDASGSRRSGPHRLTYSLKREALEAGRREEERARRRGRDHDGGRATFERYAADFLQGADLRPATIALYETQLRRRIVPALGAMPVADIRIHDVRALLAGLTAEGVGARTVEVVHEVLSRVLSQGVEDEIIESNVARRVRPPKAERREIRVLTSAEVERIAAAIDPRYRALVHVGAWAGLRFGEATALRVGRLRLLERRVDVVESLTEVRGRIAFGPLKTSGSRRTVTVPAFLVDELASHVERFVERSDLVFTSPTGGPIHRSSWRQRFWLPAVRRAGVDATFHHLRHHSAAVAIASGAHVKAIQERLGHGTVRVTLDTYGHLLPGLDDDLARRLDEARTLATLDPVARLSHENVVPIREAT